MRRRFITAFSLCEFPCCWSGVGARLTVRRLIFMTYNGFLMISVAVGAFIGYIVFGEGSASKSVACH